MLRRLYDWCIAAAGKPHASWIMGAVSFVESSFFPVPPDAMLIPMALARPDKAYFYATLCTIASGFAEYPIIPFILWSFVCRGMRFYLAAFLLSRYGPQARAIIEERLTF